MPFGISSAPEFFQKSMGKILNGLRGVICLMDDILVFGSNAEQHWKRLRKVLERIQKSGMTLKKEKCDFGCNEIKFLGHVVSGSGIKPDLDKVKAIMEIKPPLNKTEARRFTGMVNYLSKFSSALARLCIPIYKVSGSRSEWIWGPDQQDAFEKVKAELAKAPVLCTFDINKRHSLYGLKQKCSRGSFTAGK
jgi:hypothetical protein